MTETISLWGTVIPHNDPAAQTPNRMTRFPAPGNEPAPAVVVLPGGAYAGRAPHEGKPIAAYYQSQGFHAFVVDYRVAPNRFPAALSDVQRAIRLIRQHAADWCVDSRRIFVCGFSAGGHLAACAAILTEDHSSVGDETDAFDFRPNGAILCYPVISGLDAHGHTASHQQLLGEQFEELRAALSLQDRVDEQTVPCFIWHTAADAVVPVVHSLVLAEALAKHHIPYELHIFPYGYHGLGLALSDPQFAEVARWAGWSADWIRRF